MVKKGVRQEMKMEMKINEKVKKCQAKLNNKK